MNSIFVQLKIYHILNLIVILLNMIGIYIQPQSESIKAQNHAKTNKTQITIRLPPNKTQKELKYKYMMKVCSTLRILFVVEITRSLLTFGVLSNFATV